MVNFSISCRTSGRGCSDVNSFPLLGVAVEVWTTGAKVAIVVLVVVVHDKGPDEGREQTSLQIGPGEMATQEFWTVHVRTRTRCHAGHICGTQVSLTSQPKKYLVPYFEAYQ